MSGWITVAAIASVFFAAAVVALHFCARRWWDYLAVAVLTVLLFPLLANSITGDISRYVPLGAFSEGGDGKDQIIIASIASTILAGVILAACLVWAARWCWQRLRP
ncbi:MAG TPA: hypothetical protein VKT73_14760 [Xanthobacteraceae bacterium]|nr:hypothetical protein [Xanthobacteraceae bacterium]